MVRQLIFSIYQRLTNLCQFKVIYHLIWSQTRQKRNQCLLFKCWIHIFGSLLYSIHSTLYYVFRINTRYQSCKWRFPPWKPPVASIWPAAWHDRLSCNSWLWEKKYRNLASQLVPHLPHQPSAVETPAPLRNIIVNHPVCFAMWTASVWQCRLGIQTCICLEPCQSLQFWLLCLVQGRWAGNF